MSSITDNTTAAAAAPADWAANEEIQIFREYLRIPSVHPDIDYGNSSTQEKNIYIVHSTHANTLITFI